MKRSTKRRPRRLPPGMSATDWFQLQAQWDARAAAGPDGIVDIESGRDLNKFPTSSLPGSHGLSFVPLSAEDADGETFDALQMHEETNASIYGEPTGVADTPQAKAWQDAAYRAHRLPQHYDRRAVIIDWADTGKLSETAAAHGLSIFSARRALVKFCREEGLDYDELMSSADIYRGQIGPDDFVDPCIKSNGRCTCPVRRLSKKEIRALDYTPPRKR